MRIRLIGGPQDGLEVNRFLGFQIKLPFLRMNDEGDDQILGEWTYDQDGSYRGETILTTTMNADAWQRTLEYWQRQDETADELERYRERFGPLDD